MFVCWWRDKQVEERRYFEIKLKQEITNWLKRWCEIFYLLLHKQCCLVFLVSMLHITLWVVENIKLHKRTSEDFLILIIPTSLLNTLLKRSSSNVWKIENTRLQINFWGVSYYGGTKDVLELREKGNLKLLLYSVVFCDIVFQWWDTL